MKRTLAFAAVALTTAGVALAHPHFNKTVTATLPGSVEAKITYNTTPANEQRATDAAVGEFVTPRGPVLDLSGELKALGVQLDDDLYFICRSGSRSMAAAKAMAKAGYRCCHNVASGFEGPLDDLRHRGTVGGWKATGLPWLQG